MATTTPNFGWAVPTSSDLVKNGATAIETLGDAIDASMVDLKGGTTGQVLAKATNTDMDFTWSTPSAGSSNVAGKNAVLNSNFAIWQRGTSIAGTGGSGVYAADRWSIYNANYTVSRQATSDTTNLPFIDYCARVQRNSGSTATTGANFVQPLESVNSRPFIGKTATLSFYARAGANYSPTSSALSVYLLGGTGTDQNPNNTYTGQTTPISQTATLTTTWQRFSYTTSTTLATTINELAVQFTMIGTGTAGANDYFEVTGVQLEIASSASAYSPNAATIQAELAACQRYYYRTTATQAYSDFGSGYNKSTTEGSFMIPFPVTMRTTPTALEQTGTASNYNILHASGGSPARAACSSVPTYQVATPTMGRVDFIVASGLTSGNGAIAGSNNNTTAYLGWSAEL